LTGSKKNEFIGCQTLTYEAIDGNIKPAIRKIVNSKSKGM